MNDLVTLLEDRVRRAAGLVESLENDNRDLRDALRDLRERSEPTPAAPKPGAVTRERIVDVLREAVAELRAD